MKVTWFGLKADRLFHFYWGLRLLEWRLWGVWITPGWFIGVTRSQWDGRAERQ